MDYSEQQLAVISAQQDNILPITSVCNLNCKFCSHQGNPQNLKTFSSGHRSLEGIKSIIDFLSAERKIIIGESATKIEEGEPFTHPNFKEIIQLLRDEFPETTIQITTNGSRLTQDNLELLSTVDNVELNISLNSATIEGRKKLMNDLSAEVVLTGIKQLHQLGINYHGSIVAMPHLIGWSNLEDTIQFFNQYGAQTVRVFLPGYTKYSPQDIKFDLDLWEELEEFITTCNSCYEVPIILEPAQVNDLKAVVAGIIAASPADQSVLQRGDQILEVAGEKVKTRVDAFNKLVNSADPKVVAKREGEERKFIIEKKAGVKSGAVLHYDLAPQFFDNLQRIIQDYQAQSVLLLTSELAAARIKQAVERISLDDIIKVAVVKSRFFGGSILSAGLLTVRDFRAELKNHAADLEHFDLILIPATSFDFRGFDLEGVNYHQLEDDLGIEVELLS